MIKEENGRILMENISTGVNVGSIHGMKKRDYYITDGMKRKMPIGQIKKADIQENFGDVP